MINTTLIERHVTNGCPLYIDPKLSTCFDQPTLDWLTRRSVTHEHLIRHYVKGTYAASLLGIRHASLTAAIRNGRLGKPLYDYSHFRHTFEHYVLWVSKVSLKRYAQTRKKAGRPRGS